MYVHVRQEGMRRVAEQACKSDHGCAGLMYDFANAVVVLVCLCVCAPSHAIWHTCAEQKRKRGHLCKASVSYCGEEVVDEERQSLCGWWPRHHV